MKNKETKNEETKAKKSVKKVIKKEEKKEEKKEVKKEKKETKIEKVVKKVEKRLKEVKKGKKEEKGEKEVKKEEKVVEIKKEVEKELKEVKKGKKEKDSDSECTFADLNINPEIVKILDKLELTKPTPIQRKAIPAALEGKDLIGIAQTGTGKTLAFALPMIQKIISEGGKGLIVAPTRELATQVAESFIKIGRNFNLKVAILIGGEKIGKQLFDLRRNPQIIVATPGRLIDHTYRKSLSLRDVKFLVLDEADMMFDLGFAPQIEEILLKLPKERQTMLFSATMPRSIADLASRHLKLPISIEVSPQGTSAENVEQEVIVVPGTERFLYLKEIVEKHEGSILVFVRTKHGASNLTQKLVEFGQKATEIHSNLSLPQRKRSLESFKSQRSRILVATDVAARGLDINGIELVVNYNLPDCSSDYVHRIGRTGRAGKSGKAISIATADQFRDIKSIEGLINKKLNIKEYVELRKDVKSGVKRSRKGGGGSRGRFGNSGGNRRSSGSSSFGGDRKSSSFGGDRRTSSFGSKPSGFNRSSSSEGKTDFRSGRSDDRRSSGSSSFGGDRKSSSFGGDRRTSSFGSKPSGFNRSSSSSEGKSDYRGARSNDRRSSGSSSFGGERKSSSFGGDRRTSSFGSKPSGFNRGSSSEGRSDYRGARSNDRRSSGSSSFGGERKSSSFGGNRRTSSFGDGKRRPSSFDRERSERKSSGFSRSSSSDRRSSGSSSFGGDRRTSSFGSKSGGYKGKTSSFGGDKKRSGGKSFSENKGARKYKSKK